jgi:hypothetical protein
VFVQMEVSIPTITLPLGFAQVYVIMGPPGNYFFSKAREALLMQ